MCNILVILYFNILFLDQLANVSKLQCNLTFLSALVKLVCFNYKVIEIYFWEGDLIMVFHSGVSIFTSLTQTACDDDSTLKGIYKYY